MRWGTKPAKHVGDKKVVKKFLFLPKKIENEWRWLERAEILQAFLFNDYWREFKWKDIEWVD